MNKIKIIQKVMSDWYGYDLTDEQVQDILDNSSVNEKYITEEGGIDTVEREQISNYLGRKITGMYWPCNGDSEDYKQKFWKTLKENSKKLGYKLNF